MIKERKLVTFHTYMVLSLSRNQGCNHPNNETVTLTAQALISWTKHLYIVNFWVLSNVTSVVLVYLSLFCHLLWIHSMLIWSLDVMSVQYVQRWIIFCLFFFFLALFIYKLIAFQFLRHKPDILASSSINHVLQLCILILYKKNVQEASFVLKFKLVAAMHYGNSSIDVCVLCN